jgi:hypothetical protein
MISQLFFFKKVKQVTNVAYYLLFILYNYLSLIQIYIFSLALFINSLISICHKLKYKIMTGNAMVAQADKGKTIIIIDVNEYSGKIHKFLSENNFQTLLKDPTEKYQKSLHRTMLRSNLILNKQKLKQLLQKKPSSSKLNAQLKLHKPDIPIRPIINNLKASSYKLAKYLAAIL